MDETQFIALFCFDHDCLRQGGGDVSESLFEAGSGVSEPV